MKMRLLSLLLIFFNLSVHGQDLKRVSLSKKEISSVKAHYQWESTDGHFAIEDLWLLKNGTYEYKITSNLNNAFSDGVWNQSEDILTLTSELQKDNLPIKVSFHPKGNSDFDVKRIAFLRDLNDSVVWNAFVYINNDSTSCMDGDLTCRGEYTVINRIRVQYENYGISSQWVNIKPFEGLLQVTIQSRKDLRNFIVFASKKYRLVNNRLKLISE